MDRLKELIEKAWKDRSLLENPEFSDAIEHVVQQLDQGVIRVAEPDGDTWKVNEWIKKAVILYFPLKKMEISQAGSLQFYDKIPLKKGYDKLKVRAVPHAVARFGAYLAPGVILMPSYVNIGA